jgi:1,4-dihydroxy-2-naphthoate polyprenyltransferase
MMQTGTITKVWAAQIRAPFLILSVLLVALGGAAAWRDGVFQLSPFLLSLLGVTLAHVAVNLLNELSDHATGIDDHTRKTPFSGGSGTLQAGLLSRSTVRWAAVASLSVAAAIALFLTATRGWPVAAFALAGGAACLLYTRQLARWTLGEAGAGISLGSFVVLGTYYVQAEQLTASVLLLSVPAGIATALLLLLNEFPDAEADRRGGRRHLVIVLGHRGAAVLYTLTLVVMYAVIAAGTATGTLPMTSLLAFLTVPLAARAARVALRHGHEHEPMIPALGANVAMVLGTDFLLTAAFLIDKGIN